MFVKRRLQRDHSGRSSCMCTRMAKHKMVLHNASLSFVGMHVYKINYSGVKSDDKAAIVHTNTQRNCWEI